MTLGFLCTKDPEPSHELQKNCLATGKTGKLQVYADVPTAVIYESVNSCTLHFERNQCNRLKAFEKEN